jgi:thiamine pyrophosphokinase
MGLSAVVFTGGPQDFPLQRVLDDLGVGTDHGPGLVVAADSGLSGVRAAGLVPDLVVGDMDSVDPIDLRLAEEQGAKLWRFPADKDATDLELALEVVAGHQPESLTVVGSASGRMDHLVGWLRLVTSPVLHKTTVTAWMGDTLVLPIHRERAIAGQPGSVVSLVAQHGDAHGVSTVGLRWELTDQTLPSASTLGISNEFCQPEARISVGEGTVAAIIPNTGHQTTEGEMSR